MAVGLKLQDYKIFALTYSTSSWLHIFHWILISSYAAWPGVIYFISSYFITICSESLVRQLSWDELQPILCLTQTSYMSTYLFSFCMCEHMHVCSWKGIHLTDKGWPFICVNTHMLVHVSTFIWLPRDGPGVIPQSLTILSFLLVCLWYLHDPELVNSLWQSCLPASLTNAGVQSAPCTAGLFYLDSGYHAGPRSLHSKQFISRAVSCSYLFPQHLPVFIHPGTHILFLLFF